jgi:hypothetical protein
MRVNVVKDFFFSKSTIINENIRNKINNILNYNLQLTKEEQYVCTFCLNLIKKEKILNVVFQIIFVEILL